MLRDNETFSARFKCSHILTPKPQLLALRGTFDIINITLVLNQRNWETQVLALKEVVWLSKPGAMVVGFQVGLSRPAVKSFGPEDSRTESLSKIWEEVGIETKTKWKCEAELYTWDELGLDSGAEDAMLLESDWFEKVIQFVANRIDEGFSI